MLAHVISTDSHGNGALKLTEIPRPPLNPREVLIRVHAAGLNRADLSQLEGTYRQPATARSGPQVAGLEVAGEVAAVGAAVTRFRVGQPIMTMCGGGYAEYTTVDERLPTPIPDGIDYITAAAIPVAFTTAHNALVTVADVQRGDAVLVSGASSTVGLAAVQIARWAGAGRVIATASPAKHSALQALGATHLIDYTTQPFDQAVKAITDGGGIDIVIDMVGGDWLARTLPLVRPRGRIVSVGRLGATIGELDMDLLAKQRLSIHGVSFRSRSVEEYAAVTMAASHDLLGPIVDGTLRPCVDRTFPFEQATQAQQYLATNQHLGKVVLQVTQS